MAWGSEETEGFSSDFPMTKMVKQYKMAPVVSPPTKDWVMPDENPEKYLQGESADDQWDKLPSKHFTIKRIQEWVKRDSEGLNGPTAIKVDGKCICQPQGLNQSGNAILRITAGALPRGLHILNLLKNNISAIEGLRENLPAMFYVDSFIL
ncbi:hypothetical protein WN944_010754 [Citrus x changshan-huyou]|uniref:Uncharacterized protein n=1 Tax=Citrus x changshan-huyou TaxID=2935761 RepID=A0AAP0MVN7_9ROSI